MEYISTKMTQITVIGFVVTLVCVVALAVWNIAVSVANLKAIFLTVNHPFPVILLVLVTLI
jgi:hypothetical protein